MASRKKSLNRRAFLRGAGNIAVALPVLEIMLDSNKALAQTAPRRFALLFAGQSTGADRDRRNFVIPLTEGPGYTLPPSLTPLGNHGVKGDVSVVSGLHIPVDTGTAFRDGSFHKDAHYSQITGLPSTNWQDVQTGPSADYIVGNLPSNSTRFRTLNYQGQPTAYRGSFFQLTSRPRSGGGHQFQVSETSPATAYASLFTGFSGSELPQPEVLQDLLTRRSVLDFIMNDRQKLLRMVGSADKSRIEQHFDEIRALETRLQAQSPTLTSACQRLPDPGADPAIMAAGSGELERNRLFADLIHMAFVCDLNRSASLMMSCSQTFMPSVSVDPQLSGAPTDVHELGHGFNSGSPRAPSGTPFYDVSGGTATNSVGGSWQMSLVHRWHVDHFAYLVKKLKDTPEGAGTVLDNSAIMMIFEGGHGGEADNGASISSHSTQNMVVLLAGRAGGLTPGSHIRTAGVHPARVTTSAMYAVGAGERLGDVNGRLPQLFGG